jgi:hypothetical protein
MPRRTALEDDAEVADPGPPPPPLAVTGPLPPRQGRRQQRQGGDGVERAPGGTMGGALGSPWEERRGSGFSLFESGHLTINF